MLAIYKKELRSYFNTPIGYVFVGIFLALSALVCCYTTLQSNSYDTALYFYCMIFAFVILIPILTMRSFAEERSTALSAVLVNLFLWAHTISLLDLLWGFILRMFVRTVLWTVPVGDLWALITAETCILITV